MTNRTAARPRPAILRSAGAAGAVAVAAALIATALPSGAATTGEADTGASVLAASAGCGRAPTLNNGTHTISSGGTQRSFVLRLPGNYDNNRPYRLIFGFHWLNGNAGNVVSGDYYGLGGLSNNSAIFVAPQGLDNGWANPGGRDVTFTDDMVSRITGDLCVDTTQLFSLGFSYGGGMSYALACARSNVFRAVAIYSGGVISGCSGGSQPIGYLQAHGLTDNVLGIAGARSMRDRFVGNNGCAAANPPEPSQGSGRHTSFAYSGCRAGYPLEWHAFDGGHTATPRDSGSNAEWLPGVTWRFFTQFEGSPNPPTTPPVPPTTPPVPPTTPPVPPTTPPVPPTSPPGNDGCVATYRAVGQWTGGFQGEVTVRNGTSATTSAWTATLTFANGQQVTQAWGATVSQSGAVATGRNMSWNGTLAAGGTTTFGFLGSWTGSNTAPTVACTMT